MTRRALITGASSGLGAEYARQLADRRINLVLVARDAAALDRVAQEMRGRGVQVDVLVADLLDTADLDRIVSRVGDADRPIDLLVNNAGFGLPLDFARNAVEAEVDHLRLHVEVPMRLMHAALPGMLERRSGTILNIASVSAVMPRSTYGAVKNWQVQFSRWASGAYRSRGVTVTAVCPGYTHTDFHSRLGLARGEEGISDWLWLEAPRVVEESLRDAERGKAVSVPSKRYKAIWTVSQLAPSGVMARLAAKGR